MSSDTFKILKINGADALNFLQGQLSNDIAKINDKKWQLNAYCQHQGRIIALLWVGKFEADFYLIMPDDLQDVVFNRLQMFALNSDINIEKTQQNPLQNLSKALINFAKYPQIYAPSSEKFIPQDLNLDVGEVGVNFTKGCYPGQEVVARVHYLGKPKKRLYRFSGDFSVSILDKITLKDTTKAAGVVLNQTKVGFFGVVKIALIDQAFFIGNQPIKLLELADFSH